MTIHVELSIDNATHFLFKDKGARTVFLRKVKGTLESEVAPKSDDAAKVVWELEPDFDRFVVSVGYKLLGSLDFIIVVTQAYTFDGTQCVETAQDARPRAFATHAHPLLQATATSAGGVARLDLKLKTQVVDLTEVLVFFQAHDATYTISSLRSTENAGPCDVRVVAAIGANDACVPFVVIIPPAAKTATGPVGAMTFYGPGIAIPRVKGKDEDGLRNEFFQFFSHAGRYTKSPAAATNGSGKVDGFGITVEDNVGFWPNVMLAREMAAANKPMIFILTWGGWGTLSPDQVSRIVALLWGQNRIATTVDQGMKLGRFGIAGFSFGGQAAMDAVGAVGSRASEVWLFDPKFNQTTTDTGPDADARNASVVSWYRDQSRDKTKMLRLVAGVFEVLRLTQMREQVRGAANFASNFSLAPKALADGAGVAYYGIPKIATMDADFKKAFQLFLDAFGEKKAAPLISGVAHQWVVVGGEGYAGKSRLDPSFITYLGDCLKTSGF